MKTFIAAIGAVCVCAGSAMADLAGTQMTMSVNHAGPFAGISGINNVTYTYASPSTFVAPGWGNLLVTSPDAAAVGMDNAMKLDFTAFSYTAFAGAFATTGTLKLTDIDEPFDLATVKVLVNGTNIATGVANFGNGFQASWSTQAVLNGNPLTPNVVVAWDSLAVPAPGALALLGLAGLAPRRRRLA
jgi:hypothetical protein